MTTGEITRLRADWIRSYEVPPNLDPRSRRIREDNKAAMEAWDLLACPNFGWIMAMQFGPWGCYSDLFGEPRYRWIGHGIRLLAAPCLAPGNDPDLLAVHQARLMDVEAEIHRLLNAALLARDATVERVAGALDYPVPAVDAYASLFFDVLDRKDDPAYIWLAARWGMRARRWMCVPDEPDPAAAAILAVALNGTVEEAVEAVRGSRET